MPIVSLLAVFVSFLLMVSLLAVCLFLFVCLWLGSDACFLAKPLRSAECHATRKHLHAVSVHILKDMFMSHSHLVTNI